MVKAKVEGVAPLTTNLARAFAAMKAAKEPAEKGAAPILARAKALAPVGVNGALKRSGRIETQPGEASVIFGGGEVGYVFPVHEGTVNPRPQGGFNLPQPFLTTALAQAEDQAVAAFANEIDKLIAKIGL